MPYNNNKQYLVSSFYKNFAFFRVFFFFNKRTCALCHSSYIFLTKQEMLYMQLCSSNISTNKLTFIYLENVVRLVLFAILFKTAKNLI